MQRATERLQTLRSREHLNFFAYQNRPENLTSFPAASVLRQNIEYAFAENGGQTEWERSLGQTSQALFEFYWNNAHSYLTLIHDLFFAGSITFDPQLAINLGKWMINKLQKPKEKAKFMGELDECYKASQQEVRRLANELKGVYAADDPDRTFDDFIGSLDEEFMAQWIKKANGKYIIGKNYDRLIGMESTFGLLARYDLTNLYEQAARKWREAAARKITRGKGPSKSVIRELEIRTENERQAMVWRKVLNAYDSEHYLLDGIISCLMDKRQFLERTGTLAGLNWKQLADPKTLQARLTRGEFDSLPKGTKNMLLTNAVLMNMFSEAAAEDMQRVLSLKAGNDRMRRKVTLENEWFVAANGDQFPVDLNPDLAPYYINSLTIYPDRQKHGGYRIQIKTKFLDARKRPIDVEMFFNGNGQLYYQNRRQLILPVWLSETIKDLLLTRLDFITSGELSRKAHQVEIEAESRPGRRPAGELARPEIAYRRRPCYRTYTSTPERRYTLQTAKAQSHAAQVLEDFGVDIYQTNLERRAAGTLGENQVITIDMGVIDPNAPPNRIRYMGKE